MSAGRNDGTRDGKTDVRSVLEQALPGVKPLAGRDAKVPAKRPRPRPLPRRGTDPVETCAASPETAFLVDEWGEQIEGRSPGVDIGILRKLKKGRPPFETSVDLHEHTKATARTALRDALLAAHEAGRRCVRVVHGRGVHSPGRPILKPALAEWLSTPELAHLVMAFASALPRDGGPGAIYVLLRRKRTARPPR